MNILKSIKILALASAMAIPLGVSSASAETLKEALVAAFSGNPTLRADRARQRATDEGVPQALSGWRPTVNATGTVAHELQNVHPAPPGSYSATDPTSLNITLSQPIFRGFATVEGTAAAEATVKAGREQLLGTEQNVLFAAVQAYMNVIRDRQLLSYRRTNVGVLGKQLKASNDKFSAGVLTKTDVSQSRASLEAAKGAVALQLAQLQASEANYRSVIGHEPGKLAYPAPANVPRTLEDAYHIAQQTNPDILAAAHIEDASEHQVGVIGSALLPQATVQASANYNGQPSTAINDTTSAVVQGVLQVPLYEGGKVYSGVRQAKENVSQNKLRVIGAVRSVREGVANAWNSLIASGQAITSARAGVSAGQLALNGVNQEYNVGSRSTIDVLNSQTVLLNAQLTLATSEHDRMVASYQVLAAIGLLTANNLKLGVSYDPTLHYDSVRNKWIGFDSYNPDPLN
ncbi:MAG: TolC family outer membrane protein [Aestuariivirga sp.]